MCVVSLPTFAPSPLRCREGISHNPAEFVEHRDVGAGTAVLAETALRLASE